MKASTHDSNTVKTISMNKLKNTNRFNENSAASKIQSFYRAHKLRKNKLILNKFDVKKVKDSNKIFVGCENLDLEADEIKNKCEIYSLKRPLTIPALS